MGFSAYATALLHDGTRKRCEDLQPGDALRDHLTPEVAILSRVWQEPGVGVLRIRAGDAILDCSGDERLAAAQGPTEAGSLSPGTVLQTEGGLLPCLDAAGMPGDFMLYTLVTKRRAVIAVNGFLIHVGRD